MVASGTWSATDKELTIASNTWRGTNATSYLLKTDPAETAAVAETEMSFGVVQFRPRIARTFTKISTLLLLQSHPEIEMIVRSDIARAISTLVDSKILYGTGTSPEPTGIKATSGIHSKTYRNSSKANRDEDLIERCLDAEELLASNNVPESNYKFLLSPRTKRYMRQVKKFGAYTDEKLLTDDMMIYDYSAAVSSQVTNVDFFMADWKDAALATWGSADIMENPYTYDTQGIVQYCVQHQFDVGVLREKSMF